MRHHRILGLLIGSVLLIGCSQEKKDSSPVAADSGRKDATPVAADSGRKDATPVAADSGRAENPPKEAKPGDKKTSPTELLTKAKDALEKGDGDAGIAILEQLVAEEPKNREALFLLSRVLQVRGALAIREGNKALASEALIKSAKYARQLRSAYPQLTNQEANELPLILSNESRVLAQAKQTDAALAALEDAYNSGFADLDFLIYDHDLDNLRSLPRFQTFLKSMTAKLMAKAKERARELLAAQKPFDFDFSLPNVDGKTIARKDFAGKVLIADIWGTWCPPCREEIPHFVELQKKYEGKGLKIVGINYENAANAADAAKVIRAFSRENNMNYPCLIGDEKTRSQVPNFQGYPTTVFLDRSGKVRLSIVGAQSMSDLEAIIQELLDEKTASLR